MSFALTWLGHSAFALEIDGHPVLIDPFLTGNPLAAADPNEIHPELILLSHAHGDHLGDTVAIAQRTGAKVVSNWEICEWLIRQGVENVHHQNTGGGCDHGFVHVRLTAAHHSSSFPDGTYGGSPNGFLLTTGSGVHVYYAGDTDLFSDMSRFANHDIDVAFLPIGDNFTMGPDEAIKAIGLIRPRYVVPMHYNTFDVIAQDVAGWANRVTNETNAQPIVLDPGGTFNLP